MFIARLAKFQRQHACAFPVARIVWEQVVAPSDSSFQSARITYSNMETPLSREIAGQLSDRGVPLVSVGGFRHSRPLPPRPRAPTPRSIGDKIASVRAGLPQKVNEGIDNYVFSGDVTDLALQAQGFTELVARKPQPFDFDVFWDIFLRMAAD